jgi:hypothetical protein
MSLNEFSQSIKISMSNLGFSNPANHISKYFFNLVLKGKFGEKKFKIIENTKYSYLIDIDDNIKFNEIENFNLNLSIIPELCNYNLSDKINHNLTSFISQSEHIYIEFTSSLNGYAICKCFYKGEDLNKIFISP